MKRILIDKAFNLFYDFIQDDIIQQFIYFFSFCFFTIGTC